MWKRTVAAVLSAVGLATAAGPASSQAPATETYTYNVAGELVAVERTGPPAAPQPQSASGGTVRFQYDGDHVVAVYDEAGAVMEQYVNGPDGEVLAIIAADGTVSYPIHEELGSTIAMTDASGAVTAINAYDEYGQPRPGNVGRMQYTGQMWLPDIGVYHYRARAYHPGLGRFMQTDPVGYQQGMNLYAYVGNDPVNNTDPTGMQSCGKTGTNCPGSRTYGSEPDGQSIRLPLDTPQAQAATLEVVGSAMSLIPHPATRLAGAGIRGAARLIPGRETSVPVTPRTGTTPIGELVPTHGSTLSRTQMGRLRDDIAQNGIRNPIKYVESGGQRYVVDGHHRLQAARSLGINDVPTQQVQLPYAG